LVLLSQARPGAAAPPEAPRAGAGSASDGLSYREYQAKLQQFLATERPNGPATEVATPAAVTSPTAQGRSISTCKLFQPSPDRVPAQECMSCHGMHTTHPVEVDYEAARFQGRSDLRAGAEVVRRGVFLPDGKVACVTCHDASSRWAYRLVIPPGALVRPAVNPHDRSTYEHRPAPTRPEALPVGTSVSPTPLCTVCHTLAD
jgi:hypothetical protein